MSNSPHGNGAYFWIGLQENNLNGFEWTDGGAVKYTNWAPGEPEERADDKQQCTEIGEIGLWSSSMCTRSFPFICQVISFLFKILSLFFFSKNPRPMEKCESTPKAEREACG